LNHTRRISAGDISGRPDEWPDLHRCHWLKVLVLLWVDLEANILVFVDLREALSCDCVVFGHEEILLEFLEWHKFFLHLFFFFFLRKRLDSHLVYYKEKFFVSR